MTPVCFSAGRAIVSGALLAAVWLCAGGPSTAAAQSPSGPAASAAPEVPAAGTTPEVRHDAPASGAGQAAGDGAGDAHDGAERMLGVLPNFLTTDGRPGEHPINARRKFYLAERNTFDYTVYPIVGAMAAFKRSYGPGVEGYGKQYAASLADNTAGNLLSGAVFPSLLGQDPRYYRKGTGPVAVRMGYVVSRLFVAARDNGRPTVNAAELLGVTTAASLSNLYYPRPERTMQATAGRVAYQLFWDMLGGQLREFWPDVSRKLRHHH